VSLLFYSVKYAHVRSENKIEIRGEDVPYPIETFEQLAAKKNENEFDIKIPKTLVKNIASFNYKKPTPVQMQVIPILLNVSSLLYIFKERFRFFILFVAK
jgi:ATP-dependent RNA helicase DDX52/ROK1